MENLSNAVAYKDGDLLREVVVYVRLSHMEVRLYQCFGNM